MVKKIINELQIMYVAQATEQVGENTFTHKVVKNMELVGEQHIFEVVDKEGNLSLMSYCGQTKHQVGENTISYTIRRSNLPVCEECSSGWKADPRSPWARFANGVAIR